MKLLRLHWMEMINKKNKKVASSFVRCSFCDSQLVVTNLTLFIISHGERNNFSYKFSCCCLYGSNAMVNKQQSTSTVQTSELIKYHMPVRITIVVSSLQLTSLNKTLIFLRISCYECKHCRLN